ncbi:transcriptional regulator [Jeotgalibacillus sp. S-D1]|uniref:transcriptional regulator n=1 Tax=Jeotgalibacillus sp. S-D1 TaxID=2552189 RepID=UPI001059BF01|nr:transcriptional regulator [Jeotgalibacillus sp. S-D1]TDL32689.1 transcriptional regulator [Jeotgalibacillus sp. S-D1]
MKNHMLRAMEKKQVVEMIYLANSGKISQRRITVLKVNDHSMVAYCFLRKTQRTFSYNNILSFVSVIQKEKMVI